MGTGSITTRLIILLTCCAALIIGAGMLLDYHLSRGEILERLQRESEAAIVAVEVDMEAWLQSVQGSTLMLARILQQRQYSREGLAQMLRDTVELNRDIFGATIALAPDAAGARGGFAPYYYHRDGELAHADLAADNDYTREAWFAAAAEAGAPVWVEPYYDEHGGRVLMTTYAVPVFRRDETGAAALYAMVTADVALADLRGYLQRLRLGDSGFGVLLNRNGTVLGAPDPSNLMRHFSDAVAGVPDRADWQHLFDRALAGEVVSRGFACRDRPGRCILRLGALESTGWPVGVVYSEDEVTAPLRAFEVKLALIGFFTLLLMALAVILVTRRLTRPLTALARASDRIAQGDLDAPLPPVAGSDEVARLVRSFAGMTGELKTYIADLEAATARRSRLEGELGAAREIQMAMLPHGGEASELDPALSLWARVLPARSVGGDLYNYLRRDRRMLIAVGDVSDKGVPAALFMARSISLIQQLTPAETDPAAALASLNDALARGNDNCMFLTLFLGVLDLDRLELHFSSAGHTAPSLVRDGAVTSVDQQRGPALGLAADLVFPANRLPLRPGDRLAIFTDGVDEAFDARDEMFGLERFHAALRDTAGQPVATAGAGLFARIAAFAGDTPQSDDITLLLLDIGGQAATERHAAREIATGPRLTGRTLAWLQEVLAAADLTSDFRHELVLVTEEIVSNIEKYASLPEGSSIRVAILLEADRVELEVRDTGIAFNPLAEARRAELGGTTEQASVGGLGVHLITAITDRQSYRRVDGCNILRVTRLRTPPGP